MVFGDLWVWYPYLAPHIELIIWKAHDGKVFESALKRIIVKCHYYYERVKSIEMNSNLDSAFFSFVLRREMYTLTAF